MGLRDGEYTYRDGADSQTGEQGDTGRLPFTFPPAQAVSLCEDRASCRGDAEAAARRPPKDAGGYHRGIVWTGLILPYSPTVRLVIFHPFQRPA